MTAWPTEFCSSWFQMIIWKTVIERVKNMSIAKVSALVLGNVGRHCLCICGMWSCITYCASSRLSTPFPITTDDFPGNTVRSLATNCSKVILPFHISIIWRQWVRATECWKEWSIVFLYVFCELTNCLFILIFAIYTRLCISQTWQFDTLHISLAVRKSH